MTGDPSEIRPWPSPPVAPSDLLERLQWCAAVARWAPSKHNTQPWRVSVGGGVLRLRPDPARALPVTDPQHRELLIALGAAVQLAEVAMRSLGHRPRTSVVVEEGSVVAVELREGGACSATEDDQALLAAGAARRTDRGPLDASTLPGPVPFLLQDEAAAQGATLRLVTTVGDRATLEELVARADRHLSRQPGYDRELVRWLRFPAVPAEDGVPADHTRGAPGSYRAEFVQRDFSLPGVCPAAARHRPDTPLLGVLCTPGDSETDWLTAGRALEAVLLRATTYGAAASYLNQPVEDPHFRPLLQEQLSLPGAPQLVLRLGLGGHVTATPRRRPTTSLLGEPTRDHLRSSS